MSNSKYRKLSAEMVGDQAWDAYEAAKEAYKAYKTKREHAEALAKAKLPTLPSNLDYVFTYNYGNWSMFIGDRAEPKSAKPVGNLQDWIAQQVGGGRAI